MKTFRMNDWSSLKFLIYFLAVSFLIAGLQSCGKKPILHKYYLLEFPIIADSTTLNRQPLHSGFCEILPIHIAPAFAQVRIPVRIRTHELAYYQYHRWAVPPEEALITLLEEYLQTQRIFSHASRRLWKVVPDFQIRTYVYQLEAVEDGKRLLAHLHLDWELVDKRTEQVVVYHSADTYKPLPRRDINLLADALSELFKNELQAFSRKIVAYLETTSTSTAASNGSEKK